MPESVLPSRAAEIEANLISSEFIFYRQAYFNVQ